MINTFKGKVRNQKSVTLESIERNSHRSLFQPRVQEKDVLQKLSYITEFLGISLDWQEDPTLKQIKH